MNTLKRILVSLHRRLLPDDPNIGWTPYLWLVYYFAFWFKWFFAPFEPVEFWASVAVTPVFLWLYFSGFNASTNRGLLWRIAGLASLGIVFAPENYGAMTFFIFAGAFSGYLGRPSTGVKTLLALEAVLLATGALLQPVWVFWGIGSAVMLVVGAANIYFAEMARKNAQIKLTQDEVRQLARTAERERISRDLHDLLGHTLSMVAIKAELAGKLLDRGNPDDAWREIGDVEQTARDALAQVREAVAGYRSASLESELANARLGLQARGVRLHYDNAPKDLPADIDGVFAIVLREAVTNVIRHADAGRCGVTFRRESGDAIMQIEDDGRGGSFVEGSGLQGMRQRLGEIDGTLSLETQSGCRLTARAPIPNMPESTLELENTGT